VLPHRQNLCSSVCWDQRGIFKKCLILHASRQLRHEALSLFASSNLFEVRLHFGELHTLSMMNVLCVDPVAANALRNIEVVSSFACYHAHTMMPFFGCVSVFVDRDAETVTQTREDSWTMKMECDRNLKHGLVGEKCNRLREETVVRLLREVEAAELHVKERDVRKGVLEDLAVRMAKKKQKKQGVIMKINSGVGRALKREASMVGATLERYRETATFLG